MELECNSIGPSTFSTFPSGPTFVLSSFHSSFHSSSHFVQATSLFSTLRVEVNSEQVGAGAGAHSESERRKQLFFNILLNKFTKQIHKTCLNMFELRHLPPDAVHPGSGGLRKPPPLYLSRWDSRKNSITFSAKQSKVMLAEIGPELNATFECFDLSQSFPVFPTIRI